MGHLLEVDTSGLHTVLNWATWICLAICMSSLIITAGKVAQARNSGEGIQNLRGILIILVASAVCSVAVPIVSQIIS